MTAPKRVLFINGSPKGGSSTSGSLGNYVMGKLPGPDIVKETVHAGKAIRKEEEWNKLVRSADDADAILVSFPLYVDSLPGHLTLVMESLRARRKESPPGKTQMFYAMANNGFPEPWHNEIALAICKQFAKEAGFGWGGALNIGGGSMIGGMPLEETGGKTIYLRQTLDMAARAIAAGEPLPLEVGKRLERSFTPTWLLLWFGGFLWRSKAKAAGAKGPLDARPYEP